MMQILALGPLRWRESENHEARALPGKLTELLAYLVVDALGGRPTSRSRLAGALFPDNPEAKSRRLLNNLIYRLKQELGPAAGCVVTTPDAVALTHAAIDALDLSRALSSGDAVALDAALAHDQDDLLTDLDAEWILPERARLRAALLTQLPRLVDRALSAGDDARALLLLTHWRRRDPTSEHACETLMRLHWRAGRAAQALLAFDDYARALRDEIGIAPGAEVSALAEAIRADSAATAAPPARTPFVGRRDERARLLRWLSAPAAGNRLLLIEGEPGIGKSALARELIDAAAWRGLVVAHGEQSDAGLLSPLSAALAGVLHPAARAALAAAVGSMTAQTLFALIDGAPAATAPGESRIDLGPLVRAALDAAAHGETLLLVLDDVQWADDSLWEVLPALLAPGSAREKARLAVVLLARGAELRANAAAWAAITAIDTDGRLERLPLLGFGVDELAELAHALGRALDPESSQRLHQLSNGNPLLARELALRREIAPARLDELFAARLQLLTADARRALAHAALTGREFAFELWQAACPPALRAIPVNELLRAQLVLQSGNRYALQHDLLLAHLNERSPLAPEEQRAGHARIAAHLRDAQPREGRAAAAQIARHFELAGAHDAAFEHYERAVDHATALRLNASASQLIAAATGTAARMTENTPARERAMLRVRLMRLKLAQAQNWSSEQAGEADAIAAEAQRLNDTRALIDVRRRQLRYLGIQGRFDVMNALGDEAVQLSRALGDPELAIGVAVDLTRLRIEYQINFDRELPVLQQLLTEAEALDNPALLADVLLTQTSVLHKQQKLAEADATLRRIQALRDKHPALSLNELAYLAFSAHVAYAYRADVETAREIHLQRLRRARPANDFTTMRGALHSLTIMGRVLGQLDDAVGHGAELLDESLKRAAPGDDPIVHFARSVYAECLAEAGQLDESDEVLAPVEHWLNSGKRGGLAAFTGLVALAALRREQHRFAEAVDACQRVLDFLIGIGSLSYVPMLMYADAAWFAGRHDAAREMFEKARPQVDLSQPIDELIFFHWVDYQIHGNSLALARARATNFHIALKLRTPRFRRDALTRRASNRDNNAAWAALREPLRQRVTLARAEALGPGGGDVTFDWTVDDRLLDAVIERERGRAAVRIERLKRLSLEANMAGAAATHQQLADVLGVSLRTVDRDIDSLAGQGVVLHTHGVLQRMTDTR